MGHCPPGCSTHGIFPGMNVYVTDDENAPIEQRGAVWGTRSNQLTWAREPTKG